MTTKQKVNVFAKAQGKTATVTPTKAKKETVWALSPLAVSDPPTLEQLNEAVSEVHRLHAEAKTIETQQSLFKGLLKNYADERYVESIAATGVEPPSPLKVVNNKGQTVTFVVQERGGKVSDAAYDQLTALVGEDAASTVIYEGGEFKFEPTVMSQDSLVEGSTVQDVVAEAISETLQALVEAGKLRPEQVDGLLSYTAERRWKPKLVQLAVEACGRNVKRLTQFLDIVGGACVRYIKA